MALAWLVAAPGAAGAWELDGKVRLLSGGQRPAAGVAQSTIVYFQPAAGTSADAAPTTVEIEMRRKMFSPRVVAVPPGSRVAFPNRDPILHNAFSVSEPNTFDLGLYRAGEGEPVELEAPGIVRVFCNVHPTMVAYVLVLDTPHFVRPGADGVFRLDDLPAGGGSVTVWNEQAEPWTALVEEGAPPLEIEIEIDRPLVPVHTNKFGKPYPRDRRRRAY